MWQNGHFFAIFKVAQNLGAEFIWKNVVFHKLYHLSEWMSCYFFVSKYVVFMWDNLKKKYSVAYVTITKVIIAYVTILMAYVTVKLA